ncbi:hypothetical protein ZIOFF_031549 [Zingiber officinale]|uniref:Uncharacterized protein n=1 Tax=Zingiber officinale TaxID=94328 RepID=A0A8J5LA29_ZINOF|nr:hypothetical protein ZIOFF_031549 [Zingiber officinale]
MRSTHYMRYLVHCKYATLASQDVDCCLILESPFYLEGKGGLFEYVEKTLKENAEGAGQDLIVESMKSMEHEDASGNKLLLDVGLWLSQRIKVHFIFNSKPISIYLYFQSRVVFIPVYIHHALNAHLSKVQF